jgi:hypothetical protein
MDHTIMRNLSVTLACAAIGTCVIAYFASQAPAQGVPVKPDNFHSFRISFGERFGQPADRSGNLRLSTGRLVQVRPWRFIQQDRIHADMSWSFALKRAPVERQPDQPQALATSERPDNLLAAGVEVTVEAPAAAAVSAGGANWRIEFRIGDLADKGELWFADVDARVQWIPQVSEISPFSGEQHDYPAMTVTRAGIKWLAWQAYQDYGDHVYATNGGAPARLTQTKQDVYRTAVAEDGSGKVWVVWSQRNEGDWHLTGRAYDGSNWSAPVSISSGYSPNQAHVLVRDSAGDLVLVWVGYRGGKSFVLSSRLRTGAWSKPEEISGESAWAPDAAADSKGNVWVAWDSYRSGNYDIYLRRISTAGHGVEQVVAASPLFQAHASVTVDARDRVWLAWDESGANWGKDWSHEDPWRGTTLYSDRRIRVAALDGGDAAKISEPASGVESALPTRYNRYVHSPRIRSSADGRVWLGLQVRTLAGNNRADLWAAGGRWEHFYTTLDGDRWRTAVPVPQSSARPEGAFALLSAAGKLHLAWVCDNRPAVGNNFSFEKVPPHSVYTASLEVKHKPVDAKLAPFRVPVLRPATVHADEPGDVALIRDYRAQAGGKEVRIVRGDFHRHTEISGDGSGDGSLEDYFRYMIDAAVMDTGIIGDHNAGNDNEYSWWRTEKAIDLYRIDGRFTPLFGYERSVAYPNGHRNVVFAKRGVRTLPITPEEQKGVVNSGSVLYPYLKKYNGIAMLHSLATGQGSDYRDNDPEVEPLVELYQGYHASYEYEGAPRAESSKFEVSVHGGYRPQGFWWNALAKGLKLGVQASSDHIGTHNSYALIYTPGTGRDDIVESMRRRHAYAATDNIVVDFRASDSRGRGYFMGDAYQDRAAPKLSVKILPTAPVDAIEIVHDGKFVYKTTQTEFVFSPATRPAKHSYYYVRVRQQDRNLAWSSPIWVSGN